MVELNCITVLWVELYYMVVSWTVLHGCELNCITWLSWTALHGCELNCITWMWVELYYMVVSWTVLHGWVELYYMVVSWTVLHGCELNCITWLSWTALHGCELNCITWMWVELFVHYLGQGWSQPTDSWVWGNQTPDRRGCRSWNPWHQEQVRAAITWREGSQHEVEGRVWNYEEKGTTSLICR